jgi:hypothetical protein
MGNTNGSAFSGSVFVALRIQSRCVWGLELHSDGFGYRDP